VNSERGSEQFRHAGDLSEEERKAGERAQQQGRARAREFESPDDGASRRKP
jgi:hypothetical protein